MTTPATLLNHLRQTEQLPNPLSLLLGGEPNDEGQTRYRLGEPVESIIDVFRDRILADLADQRADAEEEETELITFEPGYRPDPGGGTLTYLDAQDDVKLRQALATFPGELTTLSAFTKRGAEPGPASFVLVTELPTGEKVRFFKKASQPVLIEERGKVLTQILGSSFRPIRGSPYVFDLSFSCVQVGRVMFIRSPAAFEYLFSYDTGFAARAALVLPVIRPLLSSAAIGPFETAARRSPFALRRMATMQEVLSAPGATVERFESVIDEFHLQHVRVESEGGVKKLVYEPGHIREFVRLLAEDYQTGRISGRQWEIASKRRHG